jgi:hypothetical protein
LRIHIQDACDMTEDRLKAVENHVTELRIANARTSESIDHLSSAVTGLTTVVQEFRDTINRGRGAVWLFGILAAAVGGLISWATTLIFR